MDNKLETSLSFMAKIKISPPHGILYFLYMFKEVICILSTHFGTLEASVLLTVSSCLIALYSFFVRLDTLYLVRISVFCIFCKNN